MLLLERTAGGGNRLKDHCLVVIGLGFFVIGLGSVQDVECGLHCIGMGFAGVFLVVVWYFCRVCLMLCLG